MLELAGIIILGIIAQWVAWRLKLPAILPLILIGLLVGPVATLFTEDGERLITTHMERAGGTSSPETDCIILFHLPSASSCLKAD